MIKFLFIVILLIIFIQPVSVFAKRTSVDDAYQAKRVVYQEQLQKLTPENQQRVKQMDKLLVETNQKVLTRFDGDIAKMTAILEEYKKRQNLEGENTKVAYGQGASQLDQTSYWLNYAAEALAYQKIQDYTPQISGDSSVNNAIKSQTTTLKADLIGLKGKILKAKGELLKIVK